MRMTDYTTFTELYNVRGKVFDHVLLDRIQPVRIYSWEINY